METPGLELSGSRAGGPARPAPAARGYLCWTLIGLAIAGAGPVPAVAAPSCDGCAPPVVEQALSVDTLEVTGVTGFEVVPHADVLPRGHLTLSAGWSEPPGPPSEGDLPGSGNQTYFGGVGWGASERATVLFGIGMNGDPTYAAVQGRHREQYHFGVALGGRAVIRDYGWSRLGVQAAAEVISLWNGPGLFNAGSTRERALVGAFSLGLPLTFALGPGVRATLVPSVARLPERVLGARYFGTVLRFGGRMDARVSDRWTVWGSAELPLGPGESSLRRDGALDRLTTWRAGLRYRPTPRVVIDATVSNASEATPAMRHLTQLGTPVTLLALGFRYAPTVDEPSDPAAAEPAAPLDAIGGITSSGAGTVTAGRARIAATIDGGGAYGTHIALGFGRRIQFEVLASRLRGADTAGVLEAPIADALQYRLGPQLQVLDRAGGDPLSVAARLTVGRDVDDQLGYLLVEAIAEGGVGGRGVIVLNPIVVESGGRDLASVGIGARLAAGRLELLPEGQVSFSGEIPVWTLGVRLPAWNRIQADLFTTTASGSLGVGRLLADPAGFRTGVTVRAAL